MTSLKVLVRVVIILLFNAIYIELQGQSPEKMSFQAVIRDASGELVTSSSVGLKMSILQGSVSGTLAYSETHNGMTNSNGLITLEIGGGTVVSGVYGDIVWGNGPYFLKREIDPSGGTNYVVNGTSQILSVPYAMYANVADTVLNAPDTSSTNEIQTISKVDRTVTLSNNGGSFVDSVLTEAQVDAYVNNNGYLTSEVDSSITNEIQTISKVDRTVILSNSGGIFVDSVLTEAQVDAYVNNNRYLTSEVDSSITNEIQELSVSCKGDILYLSQSNYVIIPGLTAANFPVSDIDGNGYDTVHIGNQVWFAENLRTTRYNDSTFIPNVTDSTTWSVITTGARVYYDNDSTQYDCIYGALYNGYAVETGKLCPTGWHVPTDAEWKVLTDYLGGLSVAGGKLKEIGTAHWNSPNTGATDEVGFTALPGGRRSFLGSFSDFRSNGYWWSATLDYSVFSWRRILSYTDASVGRDSKGVRNGFSVRCLRD